MADAITKSLGPSQSAGTVGRMITSEAAATGGLHSGLTPTSAKSTTLSAPIDTRVSDRTTDAVPGATWTFRTPQTDTVVDSFLVIEMNAASAGSSTAQNVGLNVIDFITVRSCGTVQEIPYRNVMRYILAVNEPEQRHQILENAGGAKTATAETVIVPIPAFWTPYGQGRIRKNHPGLPTHLLKQGVEVEIRMAPEVDLLAAGNTFDAGAYSRVSLVHIIRQQDPCALADARATGEWHHWGYEFQEIPVVPVAIAASASLNLDRFKGNSAGVALFPVLQANYTGKNFYELTADPALSNLSVNIDSQTYFRVDSGISSTTTARVLSYLANHLSLHSGYDTTDLSYSHSAVLVPFGGALVSGGDGEAYKGTGAVYEGSLNLRAIQSLRVDLTNVDAAAINVNALNINYARFSVESGLIRRDL